MNIVNDTIYLELNKVYKIMYGANEISQIDVTDNIKTFLSLYKVIDETFDIKKHLSDPYPGYKKILWIVDTQNKTMIILHENDNKLYIDMPSMLPSQVSSLSRVHAKIKIIDSPELLTITCSNKVAVFLHLGNISQWEEISNYIDNFGSIYFDLWITIHNENKIICKDTIKNIYEKHKNAKIIFIENKGFDIGSFFYILKETMQRGIKYDYILKLHTKSDNQFRKSALISLIGAQCTIHDLLFLLGTDNTIGMIGYNIKCEPVLTLTNGFHLLKAIHNVFNETDTRYFLFPGGTIFWIKGSIIYNIFTPEIVDWFIGNLNDKTTYDTNWMNLTNNKEIGNVLWSANTTPIRDCMFEHAMERFFGYIVDKKGFKILNKTEDQILYNGLVIK